MSEAINYQKCPKCDGEGYVFDPNFMGTVGNKPCPVCNGAMIIPMYLPPSETFTSQERDEFAAGLIEWMKDDENLYREAPPCPERINGSCPHENRFCRHPSCEELIELTSDEILAQYKESLKLK
jgi:hypothetical protein